MSRRMPRTKPGMARITVLASDITLDRFLPIEVAKAQLEAGNLVWDDGYCLPKAHTNVRPIIPAFLRNTE